MSAEQDLAVELIKRHEGWRAQVYDDATGRVLGPGSSLVGHPTIGYGRALDVKGISLEEGEALLRADLVHARESAVFFADYSWAGLNPTRRAVLIDMAHNLGQRGLMAFTRFRLALQDGNYDAAAEEMLDSRWARQVKGRADRLAEMMRTGQLEK